MTAAALLASTGVVAGCAAGAASGAVGAVVAGVGMAFCATGTAPFGVAAGCALAGVTADGVCDVARGGVGIVL